MINSPILRLGSALTWCTAPKCTISQKQVTMVRSAQALIWTVQLTIANSSIRFLCGTHGCTYVITDEPLPELTRFLAQNTNDLEISVINASKLQERGTKAIPRGTAPHRKIFGPSCLSLVPTLI